MPTRRLTRGRPEVGGGKGLPPCGIATCPCEAEPHMLVSDGVTRRLYCIAGDPLYPEGVTELFTLGDLCICAVPLAPSGESRVSE